MNDTILIGILSAVGALVQIPFMVLERSMTCSFVCGVLSCLAVLLIVAGVTQ